MNPSWCVPTDLCLRLVNPNGFTFIFRALMRGAKIKREATVRLVGTRYVADLEFERPIGPEHQTGVVVQLGVVLPPGEGRAG